MDPIIQSNIDELIIGLKKHGSDVNDPVSKLMISALLFQAQKIKDEIDVLPQKILDRLCSYFIPKNKIDAIPSLCLVQPKLKARKDIEAHHIIDGSYFTYRIDSKQSLSYYPLFRNCLLPYSACHLLTPKCLVSNGSRVDLHLSRKGSVWLGLELPTEIESLESVSFYIRGTSGVLPERICTSGATTELSFVSADNLSDIPMMEPFDSQQMNPASAGILSDWKSVLANSENGRLIYVTDSLQDRDIFKRKAYPKVFQQFLESNDLDRFGNDTLWILFDFGDSYDVPEDMEIIPNVVPAANVNIGTVSLTQSSPVAKLTKADGSCFLNIVETSMAAQKQGFNTLEEEVIVRDFDNMCYDPGTLYRDVRNLYNRFVDDYHAFVEYHGIKDGELIRSLRELVNRIGKSVTSQQDVRNRFDEGTYVMRGIGLSGNASSVKVTYLTTFGRLGNSPKAGSDMENRKDAAIEKDVPVIESAAGGEDKATPDQRYELLRYYTLTADRLFTKMDIEAFLRVQLLKEFGRDEVRRISTAISIQGAAGAERLTRGLYIDIRFKDRKNYDKALALALDRKLTQMIVDRSCISMPITISLFSVE